MANCKVMHCSCKSETQDKLYGQGMRLFNPSGKGSSQGDGYICTVCGMGSNKSKKK